MKSSCKNQIATYTNISKQIYVTPYLHLLSRCHPGIFFFVSKLASSIAILDFANSGDRVRPGFGCFLRLYMEMRQKAQKISKNDICGTVAPFD